MKVFDIKGSYITYMYNIFFFWRNITCERKKYYLVVFFPRIIFLVASSFFLFPFSRVFMIMWANRLGVWWRWAHTLILSLQKYQEDLLVVKQSLTSLAFGFKLFCKTQLMNNPIFCPSWQSSILFVINWILHKICTNLWPCEFVM